jgi:hypothetical protein
MNMDRAIFALDASVEATSLYIILCSLMDAGTAPTLSHALSKWNGTEPSLLAAAEELVRRGVLNVRLPIRPDEHLHPTTRDQWC